MVTAMDSRLRRVRFQPFLGLLCCVPGHFVQMVHGRFDAGGGGRGVTL